MCENGTKQSMESTIKVTTPCASESAACNRADSVKTSDVDPDPILTSSSWPRFLVAKSLDGKLITKHNAFVIQKAIEGITSPNVVVKRMNKAGLLLIEVDRKQYAENLLRTDFFHDIPVEISEHKTMNSCKGVITTDVVDDLTDEQILDELKTTGQGVKEVNRIMTMKDGQRSPTRTLIITFDGSKIPETLFVAYMKLKVRLYIPNPRRCYKCQLFDHTQNFCTSEAACDNCGQSGHEKRDCPNPSSCANCGEAHCASSKDCSHWIFRKQVLTYKVENNVSYYQAQKHISEQLKQTNTNKPAYSHVVSKPSPKREFSTQTDLTWPINLTSPILLYGNQNKSVQSNQMEFENASSKRSRGSSSSSQGDEDLPKLAQPPPKRNFMKQIKSVESPQLSEGAEGGESEDTKECPQGDTKKCPQESTKKCPPEDEGGESGRNRHTSPPPDDPSKSGGGDGTAQKGRPSRSPDKNPKPSSKSGNKHKSRSGSKKSRSPIKFK